MIVKRKRLGIFIIALVVLLCAVPIPGSAHERKQHDEIMMNVLFRKYEYAREDSMVQNELDVLTSACYLAIDQFNSYGQSDLDALINYGVKDIPKDIKEIGFSASGRNHRDFTHRGWDFSYSGEMKTKWPVRQNIMRSTVASVFNMDVEDKRVECFCELLYYIHILGDHEDDESYTISNGRKIDVGGRHDKNDIIHKLLEVFKELFSEQRNTHKYRALISNLQQINSELSELINSEGGVNSEEKFAEHQKLVEKTIEILSLYVPEMLKGESFFNDVFYQHIENESVIEWLNNMLKVA